MIAFWFAFVLFERQLREHHLATASAGSPRRSVEIVPSSLCGALPVFDFGAGRQRASRRHASAVHRPGANRLSCGTALAKAQPARLNARFRALGMDGERLDLTAYVEKPRTRETMRLNLGNETELYMVAAELGCHIADLYVAVAFVGDKFEDVARFVAKTVPQANSEEAGLLAAA